MSEHDQTTPPSDDDQSSDHLVNETVDSDVPADKNDDETRTLEPAGSAIGEQIGPYRILEELGEGGMGSVYLAEQREPVRRRVALKIIKAGMDTGQVIARFEAERQALAMMDHNNIAKVHDAGTTESGRPFFVMELVEGKPITKFCDDHKLGINERLEIFRQVCSAVQHAHQKGIIHRDLKPSNVLVTMQDDQPVPKVIDFGLAKATGQQLTEKTMFTAQGQVLGTLEYMSPEQANLNELDVDTRSDIYSLGVILYELLTGSTPLTRESLKRAAFMEVLKRIKEEEPERPSSRISQSSDSAVSISSVRQIEPRKLSSLMKGELDWVVMKAIEKDRSRRYETANGLANDVSRYLVSEPILARPPTAGYRIGKFIKKHRSLVATASTLTALLIAGIIGTSYGWLWALDEKRAAKNANLETIAEEKRTRIALEKSDAARARANYFLAGARWREGRVESAMNFLDRIPLRFRNTEWYFEQWRYEGSDVTCYGHQKGVYCVAYNPNGTLLASGSGDATVRLWDPISGEQIAALVGHEERILTVAFNLDGSLLASGSDDGTIIIWDSSNHEKVQSWKAHDSVISHVAFGPDSSLVSCGYWDNQVKHWNFDSGVPKKRWESKKLETPVKSVAFVPSENWFVSGELYEKIKGWDSRGNQFKLFEPSDFGLLQSISISPNGGLLAIAFRNGTVRIVELRTGRPVQKLVRHQGWVKTVAFSPDGVRLASGSTDKTIKIWHVRTGEELLRLIGHCGSVQSVTFNHDGSRVASGSLDGTIKIWDVTTGAKAITLQQHSRTQNAAFRSDGKILALASAETTAARKNDGNWAYASKLTIWDTASGKKLKTLADRLRTIPCVAFSPTGSTLAAAFGDGRIEIWDTRSWKKLGSLYDHKGIKSISFDHTGSSIAFVKNGEIRVWRWQSEQDSINIGVDHGSVSSIAFSPTESELAFSAGNADTSVMVIWDVEKGTEIASYNGHGSTANVVQFSPNGTLVASGSDDKSVRLWDRRTGNLVRTFRGHQLAVVSIDFNSDGTRLISGSASHNNDFETPGSIRIWDTASGDELVKLSNSLNQYSFVGFNPNSSQFVSGTNPGPVQLWSIPSDRETQTLRGHEQAIDEFTFTNDGKRIFSRDISDRVVEHDPSGRAVDLQSSWPRKTTISTVSKDKSRLLVRQNNNLLIVDREFLKRNSLYRQAKSQVSFSWHLENADRAGLEDEFDAFYFSVFHLAWMLKANDVSENERSAIQDRLKKAFNDWRSYFNAELGWRKPSNKDDWPHPESSVDDYIPQILKKEINELR